jgi:hypothetical protein
MRRTVHLNELPVGHPGLLWDEIAMAAAAVFTRFHQQPPFGFDLSIIEVPGCPDDVLTMSIETMAYSANEINRIRRTYEAPRLVEMAAIAIAGLGLYHAGEHRICDVASSGSGADYLVDDESYLLEIAGRARRKDLESAWRQRWQRLSESARGGFYVCVAEFETPAGRLAFHD